MTKKPKPGLNKGSNAAKTRILAYLRRSLAGLEAKHGKGTLATLGTSRAIDFILTMDDRAAKRPGGLGRK